MPALPDPAIEAEVRTEVPVSLEPHDERWTLTVRRPLPYPPDTAWQWVTQPKLLALWSPVVPDRPLDSPGPATARENPDDIAHDATVLVASPPHLLEHGWGAGRLRWTLTATPGGTELELRHTFADLGYAPDLAAGWRICLATLAATADGTAHERVVGRRAYDYGWHELRAAYAATLAPS